jgi:hypothetical protein
VTTATVGRPRTPLDLANAQALARIASLAAQVLVSLRQRGHGQYDSERRLASYLSDDGISFTTADLAPALTQLAHVRLSARPFRAENGLWPSGDAVVPMVL